MTNTEKEIENIFFRSLQRLSNSMSKLKAELQGFWLLEMCSNEDSYFVTIPTLALNLR